MGNSRENNHVKVKCWTCDIAAASHVSNWLPERVISESEKQVIGSSEVYLEETSLR